MNKTITESFRLVCKDQTDWAQNITPVLMSYRATVASPSGISPQFDFLAEIWILRLIFVCFRMLRNPLTFRHIPPIYYPN